jgi:integrase
MAAMNSLRVRNTASTPAEHLTFHSLRRFMDTYGQELGFSLAQVAVRAGHDPAVASRHYTGRVGEADRALARAISDLLGSR